VVPLTDMAIDPHEFGMCGLAGGIQFKSTLQHVGSTFCIVPLYENGREFEEQLESQRLKSGAARDRPVLV